MTERAVSFAAGGRVTGILSEPEPSRARKGAPAVLTANVGVNHHVGPNRFFVDLARSLEKRGFTSLRFDLSGLGNSAARTDALGAIERAVEDHEEAMRFLTARLGHARFVPIGLCSGVDAAHRLAVRDPRIAGVCFIEGYVFKTRGFYLRSPLRYLNRARWFRMAARRVPPALRDAPGFRKLGRFSAAFAGRDQVFVRDYPAPADLRRDYEAMSARGARQLFVYTGGDSAYNHEGQLLEFTGLPSLGSTREVVYMPEADHTFFRVADRERVIARIGDWMER